MVPANDYKDPALLLLLPSVRMVKVTVNNNGSIRIEGEEFVLQDADGNMYDLGGRSRISLCRCGMSEDKPFCDGTHKRNGFASQCTAHALPPLPAPKIA